MDRFLSWFGLALRRDVVRLEGALGKAEREHDVAVHRALVAESRLGAADAQRYAQVAFLLGQYGELKERVAS